MFADYLDELGTPEAAGRAEFIRLHVRAAQLPHNDPEREPVVRRIDQLLLAWDAAWQRELPNGFQRLSGYRRGFAYRAAAVASAVFEAVGDARLPPLEILTLSVDVPTSKLRELVRLPMIAGLKRLLVQSSVPIGWSGARAIAEGEYPRLEELSLNDQTIGDVGIRALCESWGFPRLRSLGLGNNDITDAGAEVLAGSVLFRRLNQLWISGNRAISPLLLTRLGEGTRR